MGVSDFQLRLPHEDSAAAFRVARFIHPSHDGLLRGPDGEAGMVRARRAGEAQQAAAAPHRLPENRKYGNPVVLGFQGRSQLDKRYGQDAEAMLSQPATKLFFKTTEPRAAKWISDAIGEIEVERLKESRSMGLLRSKKSYAMEIATKPLVIASEISGLEPLYGFIKQENRVVPVYLHFARKHGRQPEFIERKLPEVAPRPSPPTPVARTEQPRTPVTAQATLPLFDASADKPTDSPKEAIVWDESKGIE